MLIRNSHPAIRKLLASAAATGLALPAQAATLYVNANFANCGTSDGTAAKPFCSIQPAVTAAASGDTVQVAAGSYMEDVDIVGKALKILGADPTTTVVQGFGNVFNAHDFAAPTKIVEIANFTISNGGSNGIIFSGANLAGYVHNCIFQNNMIGVNATSSSSARVINSVLIGSSSSASYSTGGSHLTVVSSILMNNNYGAYISGCGSGATINSSYNRYFGNAADYDYCNVGAANDSTNSDPKFVDAAGGDFHLKTDSPCIDAGSPGATDKDPDGTRADQGAYGGPGSATFRPGTAGLPVVTGLLATPHDVAIGGTFTLTGTGKAP